MILDVRWSSVWYRLRNPSTSTSFDGQAHLGMPAMDTTFFNSRFRLFPEPPSRVRTRPQLRANVDLANRGPSAPGGLEGLE
jgi:hypothetical protein